MVCQATGSVADHATANRSWPNSLPSVPVGSGGVLLSPSLTDTPAQWINNLGAGRILPASMTGRKCALVVRVARCVPIWSQRGVGTDERLRLRAGRRGVPLERVAACGVTCLRSRPGAPSAARYVSAIVCRPKGWFPTPKLTILKVITRKPWMSFPTGMRVTLTMKRQLKPRSRACSPPLIRIRCISPSTNSRS